MRQLLTGVTFAPLSDREPDAEVASRNSTGMVLNHPTTGGTATTKMRLNVNTSDKGPAEGAAIPETRSMMLPCSLLVLLNAGGDAARLMTRVLGAIMRAACNTGQRSRCAKVACPGRVEGWAIGLEALAFESKGFRSPLPSIPPGFPCGSRCRRWECQVALKGRGAVLESCDRVEYPRPCMCDWHVARCEGRNRICGGMMMM